jgi:hypothetical protein
MKIVIFNEKHGDTPFVIRDEEDWYRICMQVFRDRDSAGWYYEPSLEKPEEPEKPDPMPEWAEKEYDNQMRRYRNRLRSWENEMTDWRRVEKAREGSLEAAVALIEGRRDGEYEGFEFYDAVEPDESIPHWKYKGSEQLAACTEALETLLANPEKDALNLEGLRGIVEKVEKTSEVPTHTGTNEEFRGFQRTNRFLAKRALKRAARELENGQKEDALKTAERILNRIEKRGDE